MRIFCSLIIAALLPLAVAAKDYSIKLHRPAQVGDRFRVELSGTEATTMARLVDGEEEAEMEKWSTQLKGVVTVLKVNKLGGAVKLQINVESFTITEGKFTDEAMPKGAVIRGEDGKDENHFENWDEDLKVAFPLREGRTVQALKLLFTFDEMDAKETDDDIFGTKKKRKVGDSWKLNAKALAASAKRDKVGIDPKKATGKITFASVVKIRGHECLEVKGQFTVKDVRPPMNLPRGLRLAKSVMTGRMHSKQPVNPKLPELENHMSMSLDIEITDRQNGVTLKRTMRMESHSKIEPLKPGR